MSAWPRNDLCELLGVEHPIIQAPMASATTPALVAAVSNAGGLGSLGSAALSPDQFRAQADAVRQATNKPFNVNFFVHAEPTLEPAAAQAMRDRLSPYYAALELGEPPAPRPLFPTFAGAIYEAVLALKPRIVSFHYGLPAPDVVEALKAGGARILSSATTVAEAAALEQAGADAIIAQGYEAGGHRGTFLQDIDAGVVGTFALVPQVVDAVAVPVIAAGAIADGRGIAAAFALGAHGVQIGTAFLACPEAAVHPLHRQALRETRGEDTRVTRAISGRPARAIRNRFIEEMGADERAALAFPLQYSLTAPLSAASKQRDESDCLVMWAGQGAALAREMPAGELLAKLAEDALRLLP